LRDKKGEIIEFPSNTFIRGHMRDDLTQIVP
jgi:hypothetical protein